MIAIQERIQVKRLIFTSRFLGRTESKNASSSVQEEAKVNIPNNIKEII